MIPAPLVAVDVGGTHTKIRITSMTDRDATLEVAHVIDNRSDMLELLRETLIANTASTPNYCVLSAAGPVDGTAQVRMTNWSRERLISVSDLSIAGVDVQRATVVNDMVVSALGIVAQNVDRGGPAAWARQLTDGAQAIPGGNMVVIMPGTGLGVAGVVHTGTNPNAGYHVVPCELQHAPIGHLSPAQAQVAQRMRDRLDMPRPSWESFSCGHGLVRVHQMLSNADAPLLDAGSIARKAIAGEDSVCREALELFYLCAGGIAQLTALSFLPTGGVYLSGRSSKLNEAFIVDSQFVTELRNNDTHGELLDDYPVYLVTQDTNLDGGIFLARTKRARL